MRHLRPAKYVSIPACSGVLYFWQCKVKGGALTHSTFGPYASTMAGYDALHIGKANACTFEFLLCMESLEYAEESVGIFHVKPCAIVRYGTSEFISLIFASDLDFSLRSSACVCLLYTSDAADE